MNHPAGALLREYATYGCPTKTGAPWKKEEIWEAVSRGPHASAMSAEALEHFRLEAEEKVKCRQAKIVLWDDIKDTPPPQMKVSPIAVIPHKSKAFWSILALSFSLQLSNGLVRQSVNDTTTKTAPRRAISQLSHSLQWIIHAFVEVDKDAKIFMEKWDVKDGFWRLDGQDGEEWNFAYVLPQPPLEPVQIVVPTSLQMGWVESPPYFCAETETSRDIATQYCKTALGSLQEHKFDKHVLGDTTLDALPNNAEVQQEMRYLIEVYVDDFMALVILTTKKEVIHVGQAVMHGIHDVFPEDDNNSYDPIYEKKLVKKKGRMSTGKTLLGFDFE
jgi:hypothetical protein